MRKTSTVLLLASLPFFTGTQAIAEIDGDPTKGQTLYGQCSVCHMVGANAVNRIGPLLNGIINAPAAAADDFRYSPAMTTAAEDGLVWTLDNLDAFLANPRQAVRRTSMGFRGIKDPQDRSDLIAYLATFSSDTATSGEAGFTVSTEILALEGDIAYGEYLASECTTCHLASGGSAGIPAITGWPTDAFVTAMHSYKTQHRDNQVMQMIAGRLADEEIAALAVYFESLGE